ncbi:DUF2865 domain-containing protein [Oricola indica]|uniref:DUF2865 domain-containing protein n=1 Tax=Oricola indica TaxID=2872591 RepID=UPI003CCC2263
MTEQIRSSRIAAISGRVRLFAMCLAGLAAVTATPASADVCADLRAQLRDASRPGPGTSAQARRYAEAAIRQSAEIEKTIAIQRSNGCFRDPGAACQSLNRTIQKMRANLDSLERQRDRLSGRINRSRVRAIEARMARFRCDEPQRLASREPQEGTVTVIPPSMDRNDRRTKIIVREGIGRQRLYDPQAAPQALPEDQAAVAPDDPNAVTLPYMPGTFRTLCVRTCDGYYFPVSFSTGFDFLQRDAQTCQAMCPATEAKLFFHRVPDQESEEMISLQGRPYTALPNAFLYREQRTDTADPACTCGTPQTIARTPEEELPASGGTRLSAIPTPLDKPEMMPETDTETADTAVHGPEEEPDLAADGERKTVEEASADTVEDPAYTRKRVRVVGPEFLPAPEAATDPQSQDPTSDR